MDLVSWRMDGHSYIYICKVNNSLVWLYRRSRPCATWAGS